MTNANGAPTEAGGPAQVAGAGIGDVVVATDGLLCDQGQWAEGSAAHDTVGALCLVCDTGVSAWAHNLGAVFWGDRNICYSFIPP